MPDRPSTDTPSATGRERLLWLVLLLAMCLWTAWRMGAFDLSTTVTLAGERIEIPNTFATVDHPFHATRADTLLESLREGEILRWVGNHQGGYPVEFYPLGIAWLDVALWAVLLGTVPVIAVHKLAVIAVFLLPAASFWLLARGDRLHPGVAALAMAIHLAVPGHWLNGGYTELAGWGLVTNVAGGSLALIAAASLARYVLNRERGMSALAIAAASAGALTNPRSLFALVIAAIAIVVAATLGGVVNQRKEAMVDAGLRVAIVGGLAALIATPVILPLVRFQEHYFFLHYEEYEPLSEYWTASATAATPVIVLLAIGGAVLPWVRRMPVTRAMSLTLVGYVLFTLWVAASRWAPPLVEQLEAPRLMPFQRQVMIYLGATLVVQLIQRASERMTRRAAPVVGAVAISGLAIAVVVSFILPLGIIPETYRGRPANADVPETYQSLSPVSTTGNADFATFVRAVEAADTLRAPGTSIFVIGNRQDWWHEQLWAPTQTDAPLYYDDWLWYWTTTHQGPYDYRQGHYFPNPSFALTPDYFGANGISVVMVTDMWVPQGVPPRDAARSTPELAFATTVGAWDIYRVNRPTSLVTNGDALPVEIAVENQRLWARFEEGEGTVVIRRNWFPRWQATVNGESVNITRRSDGYMELHVPPGAAEIELRYAVTPLDWVGRGASVLGIAAALGFVGAGRRTEYWLARGRR